MRSQFIKRIHILFSFIFLLALILVGNLYFIQIIHGEAYSHKADRQYVKPNENFYDRGFIYLEDKDGRRISGATIKSGFTVAINPRILENPEDVYEKIIPVLPSIDAETFFLRAGKDDPYEEIAKRVDEKTAMNIDALDIDGLNIYKSKWRYYPGDRMASHSLGFIGYRGDELGGRYGLERYYEDVLGRGENSVYVNFFAEIFANLNKTLFVTPSKRSGNIITTIEPSVQIFLENILQQTQEEWSSRQTAGVIIDPSTGEIYALGVYPNFNVNTFKDEGSSAIFSNPLVENVFEMGSIMKPLTMAAALDVNAVTADTTYYDNGSVTLNGSTISNFDKRGRGKTTMQGVLNESLNTGVVYAVGEMGNDIFRDYVLAYGLGEETGIDLPNESAGLVENIYSPRDIEYATASFGQGIAVTPMSMVRALSSLANGGELVTPHLVSKIQYTSGVTKNIEWDKDEKERVLKKETADEITRMLVHVVDNALLGGTVMKPRYSIATKTGTAQIAQSGARGYYDDRFFHSFFGYFPAYDAKFLVFLFTLEPKEVRYASRTLTKPFMDIATFLINYYEIPPDR